MRYVIYNDIGREIESYSTYDEAQAALDEMAYAGEYVDDWCIVAERINSANESGG